MAFREPLNSMLWEETRVHTGLSWARMVLTFCRVWMSHTFPKNTAARHERLEWNKKRLILEGMEVTDDDGAVCRSAVQLVSVKPKECFVPIRKLSNASLRIVIIVNVYICSSYPWIHNANTMPS